MKNHSLKFRVWNPVSKIFDDGFWIYQSGRIDHDYSTECEEVVVQQFIGLKDKNGKEIYEGDVLAFSIDGKRLMSYVFYSTDNACYGCGEWKLFALQDLEVIGNKFETPNLLD